MPERDRSRLVRDRVLALCVTKWGMVFPEAIHASEDDDTFDVFFPFEPVTPTPAEIVDLVAGTKVKL